MGKERECVSIILFSAACSSVSFGPVQQLVHAKLLTTQRPRISNLWNCNERDKQEERQTQTERDRDRETKRETETEIETERQREREREMSAWSSLPRGPTSQRPGSTRPINQDGDS